MKTSKTAVLFDLDGTLWDSAEVVAPAWNAWCAENGVGRRFTPDECRSFCGRTLEQIAELVFPELEPARREAVIRGCCSAECEPLARLGGVLYPNEIQSLELLRRDRFLAVISNCQEGYIESFFAGNGTGYLFDDYENPGRTGLSKGENIRLVMERNGIRRAVYVGDTQGDAEAARFAGVPFIHAAYGFGSVAFCDAAVTRFSRLPEAVSLLLGE